MQEEIHALAVAFAAANSHPAPHDYADSVLAHLANPPARAEPVAEAPEEAEGTSETGAEEKPADPQ